MRFTVRLHDALDAEFTRLPGAVQDALRELRFRAANGVWRATFAFDRNREAVLLAIGNKAGRSQKRFYKQLISTSDARYDDHAARLQRD